MCWKRSWYTDNKLRKVLHNSLVLRKLEVSQFFFIYLSVPWFASPIFLLYLSTCFKYIEYEKKTRGYAAFGNDNDGTGASRSYDVRWYFANWHSLEKKGGNYIIDIP